MSKQLLNWIEKNPHIVESYSFEKELGSGYWVYLKDGWMCDATDTASVHEDTVADTLYSLNNELREVGKAGVLHHFNTGRPYTADGQLICWTRDELGHTLMWDHSRKLFYVFDLYESTDAKVLMAYDKNICKVNHWEKHHPEVEKTLREYAEVLSA